MGDSYEITIRICRNRGGSKILHKLGAPDYSVITFIVSTMSSHANRMFARSIAYDILDRQTMQACRQTESVIWR